VSATSVPLASSLPTALGLGLLLAACPSTPGPPPDDDDPGDDDAADDDDGADDDDTADDDDGADDDDAAPLPLEIRSLGVGGVALRRGGDLVVTAPMLTNPDLATVTLGETRSDPQLVDALLPAGFVEGAGAILVGHAHYDHLLDVPRVQELAGPETLIYGNVSVDRLLAGLDSGATDRLRAFNDPASPWVDRRMCATPDPCTGVAAGLAGAWVDVPGTRARVRALCSTHPAQFLGIVHFGEGCVAADAPAPPTDAADWLEGATLAWLIDFLDADGRPVHRVYYQDAPTSGPDGLVHPHLTADKAIDVAVLNVGSWDAVRDHPAEALRNLAPRYALGIHWEDFFQPQSEPPVPIPFHADPAEFDVAAEALLSGAEASVLVDGVEAEGRYWRPDPGTEFTFEPAAPGEATEPFALTAWTERRGDAVALRTNLPRDPAACEGLPDAPCDDVDGDGLVDAWEDLVLERLRPSVTFDEAEPLFLDADAVLFAVGRVAPAEAGEGIRAFVMIGYSEDYGRCGVSAHPGDSERVVLDLAPVGGEPGDVEVVGLYTAAHEGTVTDHGTLLTGPALADADFPLDPFTGEPRWRVFASDGKHATYPTIQGCEDAEVVPCLDEDCAPDGVADPASFDRLPPIVNAGEDAFRRISALGPIGFPGDDAWTDQDFCGGGTRAGCASSVRSKLLVDPF